jgi:transcription antitermination factor NusG
LSSIPYPTNLISLPCFAVKVRTRGEEVVTNKLRQKGFDVLAPTFTELRRYSDRTCRIVSSLFPGYIFVRMEIQSQLRLLTTDGVSYLVRSGTGCSPLPYYETLAIEALCSESRVCEPCPYLRIGQRVRVESGPFIGVEGVLIRAQNSRRLVISVEALRSSVSIEVGADMVRVVADEERVTFRNQRPSTTGVADLGSFA